MKYALLFFAALISISAHAEFKPNFTIDQVLTEASAQQSIGKLPIEIAKAAHDAHIKATDILAALTILYGDRIANESLKTLYTADEYQSAGGNSRDDSRGQWQIRQRTGEGTGRSKSVSPS